MTDVRRNNIIKLKNKITNIKKKKKTGEPYACAGGTLGFGPLGTQSPSYSYTI